MMCVGCPQAQLWHETKVGIYVSPSIRLGGIHAPTQELIRAREYKSLAALLIQAASLGVLIEDLSSRSIRRIRIDNNVCSSSAP